MKLHRLDLEGFGPFLEPQTVDFDAFDADGLFLIAGRTGAGKSSILDGVCYALYGTAPRYDGGDRGLRSDHAGPDAQTLVRLEFTAAGQRWRVTRTPEYERPKARGAGMTVQKSSVLVERETAGDWEVRATRAREAGDVLADVVGLTRDQFQQVILLAQNRFAEFLLAGNDDRQTLLRSLFGSRRYEEYEKAFDARKREALRELEGETAMLGAQVAHAEALVDDNDLGVDDEAPDGIAARLDAIARAVPRAAYRAAESARQREQAQAAHDDALARFGERRALRQRQEERAASRRAYADLERRAPEVAADRALLERARTAEILRAPVEAARAAEAAAARATATERSAREAWSAAGEGDVDLRDLVDALAGDIAVWSAAEETERALGGLIAAGARADDEVGVQEAGLASLDAAATVRAERIAALEPAITDSQEQAPALAPATERLAEAVARLAAGRDAERLAPAARAAAEAHDAALDAVTRATEHVRALLRARLDGYAGELAAGLVVDAPCPVCGAVEHPHPAEPSDEPVDDAAVEAAEQAAARAARAAEQASETSRTARAALQDALVRAGGLAVDELVAAHGSAEALVTTARDAAALVARLTEERRVLAEEADADAAARTARADRLGALREQRAAVAQEIAAARAVVESARGDFDDVASRVAAARRHRALALALADAVDESARRGIVSAEAGEDLAARLADSPFEEASEVVAALRDTTTRAALDEQVRAHEIAFAAERERLRVLETDLAGVPDELVDLDEAAAAAAAARDTWNTAVERAARDAQVAGQLTDASARAHDAHVASAERTAEFEIVAGLADAVAGRTDSRMDLETFVLAAELEEIVEAANLRLDAMSSGRYRLQHSDAVARHRAASGLGLAVLDGFTGQTRTARSLSGGETFLASLALALGLAEVVTARAGGVRLDTLFIDEGFGSLDEETLELAMGTLDELRQGGRTVGLISHVAAMKEQLPAQLHVETTPQGPSVIRQGAAIGV